MKISILYIATGRYIAFWDDFYKSALKNFLPQAEKTFVVFTDAKCEKSFSNKDVKLFAVERQGFPLDTLMRFKIFMRAQEILRDCDYAFYFNANIVFNDVVGVEILPSAAEDGLVCALHPCMRKRDIYTYPYERNPKSLACINAGEGRYYVQGALIGGTSAAFLKMTGELLANIDEDLQNGVVAQWHDESHLNRYILYKKPKLLGLEYLCPDTAKYRSMCRGKPKILLREKGSPEFGGIDFIRGKSDVRKDSFWHRLKWRLGLK